MVRPVTGFLTSTGQYFDQEQDAKLYEAVGAFDEALAAMVARMALPLGMGDFYKDNIRHFVLANRDVVKDYLANVKDVPELPKHDIRQDVAPQRPVHLVTELDPWAGPDDIELIDIELVAPDLDTGPVSEADQAEIVEGHILYDGTPEDFVQAFEPGSLGEADGASETNGNDEVVRQP